MINSKFWSDSFVVDKLNPLDRYLFLYFLTNEKTNICGVYEVPLRTISNETGIEKEEVLRMLERLKGKVEYKNGWVCLVNFIKHQNTKSEDVKKGIDKLLANLPLEIQEWVRQSRDGLGMVYRQPEVSNLIKSNLIKSNITDVNAGQIAENHFSQLTKMVEIGSNTNDNSFDIFWKDYPNRRKGGKAIPKEKWSKLTEEQKKLILIDVPKRKAEHWDWLKQDGDFIPAPEVYLNLKKEYWLQPIVQAPVTLAKVQQPVDRFNGK